MRPWTLAHRVDLQLGLALALCFVGMVHAFRGEFDEAIALADEGIALSQRQGFPLHIEMPTNVRTVALVATGQQQVDLDWALSARLRSIQFGLMSVVETALISDGRHAEVLELISGHLDENRLIGRHADDAELYRMCAEVLLDAEPGPAAPAEAEAHVQQALKIARQQQARVFELRACMSLARRWASRGEPEAAHALLAPVHAWFMEGGGTPDLQQSRALLDELAGVAS